MTALVVHGHFYQPPRENPWTDVIDREPSAAPWRDWNERIHAECYRANAYARVVDSYGRVERIVNNYFHMSFNFGPTLLSWLERRHPLTYARVLDADRRSALVRSGHGNALAQGYNHAILPLCNERDRITQVRWGLADFRLRFGREPESLWCPETACDDATLGTLIDHGMRFVLLSPYQAARIRKIGDSGWRDVSDGSVDPSMPYRYFHRDGSGRSIDVFFYDGPVARAVAFEGVLASSGGLLDRFGNAARGAGHILNVATDGETYGHHHHFGDRSIAYALETEALARGLRVTNYGEYLDSHPPIYEVELQSGPDGMGTSWSCAHGVGRWMRDCGCNTGGREGWNQAWRAPLRAALDALRDEAAEAFESTRGVLFVDPWAARDAYIDLVLDRARSPDVLLEAHACSSLSADERVRALTFLEMQRHAMLMYTSCGWFFSDLSGIETIQIMKYAARVMDLMGDADLRPPRDRFLDHLSRARSNLAEQGTGADIFRRSVDPLSTHGEGVAAHVAISMLVDSSDRSREIAGFTCDDHGFRRESHGRITLATGRIALASTTTGSKLDYAVAGLHLGGIDFHCVLKPFPGEESYGRSVERIWSEFRTASLFALLRLAQEEFGPAEYGLEHVLGEGRERIASTVFANLVAHLSNAYAHLYEENRRTIEMLQEAGFELPKELRAAAEFTLGRRFEEEIRRQHQSRDPAAYAKAIEIAQEVKRRGYHIDRTFANHAFGEMISDAIEQVVHSHSTKRTDSAIQLVRLAHDLGIAPALDRAQEIVFDALSVGALAPTPQTRELVDGLGLSLRLVGEGTGSIRVPTSRDAA